MCMIAHRFLGPKGKGSNIPNAVIDAAISRHPDGYGIAWRDPEKGLVYDKFGKSREDKAAFRALVKEIDAMKDVEYVAHWRFATHGPEDAAHAHPYSYEDPDPEVGTVLVFHNGVISGVTTTKLESDTEVFVRDYLARLPSRWWDNVGIRLLVDRMGGWSKLVLMTQDETINLNHYSGEEDGGLWYSSEHRPTKGYAYRWDADDDWEGYETFGTRGYSSESYSGKGGTDAVTRPYESTYVGSKSADIGETTNPRSNTEVWMHQGHELAALQKFDFTKDGDYECSVICETCGTAGDVYIIDGKAYIDIPHAWDNKDDEEGGKVATVTRALTVLREDPDGLFTDSDGEPILLPSGGTMTVVKPLVN